MRTVFWLVIVILAFGLGTGAGILLRPESNVTKPIADSPAVIEQPKKPRAALLKAEAQPETPKSDSPTPADDPLMQALKGLEFERISTVEGSITASVTDSEGKPMAGVELRLYPNFPREPSQRLYDVDGTDEDFWDSVTDNLRKPAAGMIRIWRNKLTVTTDDEGRVEFAPLLDVPYNMRLGGNELGLQPDRQPYGLRPGDHVNWSQPALDTVRVTVAPCPNVHSVRIHARPNPSRSSLPGNVAPIDAAPGDTVEFKLPDGDWLISATAEKQTFVSEGVEVQVKNTGAIHEVTLRLRAVARVRVEVTYTGGMPAQRATVSYAPVRADLSDDDHFDHRRNLAVGVTEALGEYYMNAMEPGDYLVRAVTQGIVQTRRVTANAGWNVVSFEFAAPASASGIECVVEFPEETERPEFQFEAEIQRGGNSYVSSTPCRHVWKLGENRYLLTDVMRNENGRLVAISARCRELGVVRREFARETGEVLRFRFERPASLKVTVQDIPQTIGKYVSVSIGEESVYLRNDTAAFEGMQPGTREIVLRYSGLSQFVFARMSCDQRAGENREITMKMPPLYELVIEAQHKEYSLRHIAVQDDENQTASLNLGSDGRCILPYIPAGTYTLDYYKNSTGTNKQRTITIRSNTTVRLID